MNKGIGWYLLQRWDTPWLSAAGWLLLGMLLERGFDQGQPLVLAGAAVIIGLAAFIAYCQRKLDQELAAAQENRP